MLGRALHPWGISLMSSVSRCTAAALSSQPAWVQPASITARHQSGPAAAAPPPTEAADSEAGPSRPSTSNHGSQGRRDSGIDMATPGHTRKPAILKPALHQWRLCSPSYDPSEPSPSQYLPPYAPARARRTNYRALMHEQMPTSYNRNRHRRAWRHKMLVAMNAWRRNHEHSAAAVAKQQEYAKAVGLHLRREEAWKQWCRQHPERVHRGAP